MTFVAALVGTLIWDPRKRRKIEEDLRGGKKDEVRGIGRTGENEIAGRG